jgi:hypothetical protein
LSDKVKIVLNSNGIRELLHSGGIESALMQAGNKVQAKAGANFGVTAFTMPSRSVVRVSAINKDGIKENVDNNVLLKALH